MIKVGSRAELSALAGTKPAAVEKPLPVPAPNPAPAAVDPGQMAAMHEAIASMAAGIERTAALVAQIQQQPAPAGPKKLEAIVHRNTRGLMERIEITVVK